MCGGVTLLTMLVSDPSYKANSLRQDLWRAGHAHAGVLLILALVALKYVSPDAETPTGAHPCDCRARHDWIHGRTSIHVPVMTIKARRSGTLKTGWGESGSPVKEKYAAGGIVSRNSTARIRWTRRQRSISGNRLPDQRANPGFGRGVRDSA